MAYPWFRMYSEFATDPKVQVVTEALQRRYVMVLCLQCNEQYKNAPDDEIALALRIGIDEWKETKRTLIERRLLNEDGSIYGWDKRQFISDIKDQTAAERMRRHRESKRNKRNDTVTHTVTARNVTPLDTDTDTEFKDKNLLFADTNETEKNRETEKPAEENYSAEFNRFWTAYPKRRRTAKPKCWSVWKRQRLDRRIDTILADVAAKSSTVDWQKQDGEFVPAPLVYLNQGRWQDSEGVEASPAAVAGDDPFAVVGAEWLAALHGRMGGSKLFAGTVREREMVEAEAVKLGWKPKK